MVVGVGTQKLTGLKTAGVNNTTAGSHYSLHKPLMSSFSRTVMTSPGPCEHADAHQIVKSCCSFNEEKHNGRSCLEHPLAVMAELEGMCTESDGASAGEQPFLII